MPDRIRYQFLEQQLQPVLDRRIKLTQEAQDRAAAIFNGRQRIVEDKLQSAVRYLHRTQAGTCRLLLQAPYPATMVIASPSVPATGTMSVKATVSITSRTAGVAP